MSDHGWNEIKEQLPRTAAALEEGRERGLHLGAQIYVSRDGQPIADAAVGESRPGVPMSRETLVLWMSMGKPITAILLAKLVDAGHLDVNQPVADVIPEFAQNGKAGITIAHVLTHTGGFRNVGSNWSSEAWDGIIARICAAPLEDDWVPGDTAGYHIASGWYILGEIARRTFDRIEQTTLHLPALYRREIFEPVAMTDCWIGMPRHKWVDYGTQIGLIYDTSKLEEKGLRPVPFPNSEQGSTLCRPGGNARGPVYQLGRFYEQLLADRGELSGRPNLLSADTARAFTTRQRVGKLDKTFGAVIDWGYGFLMGSVDKRIPYGYGPHASAETFGHSGNQSSCAFADPAKKLVVAWATNGQPGELAHQKRQRAINTAIYEDVGLASNAGH